MFTFPGVDGGEINVNSAAKSESTFPDATSKRVLRLGSPEVTNYT